MEKKIVFLWKFFVQKIVHEKFILKKKKKIFYRKLLVITLPFWEKYNFTEKNLERGVNGSKSCLKSIFQWKIIKKAYF